MTEAEILELIDGFVAAARRAQASGFDGVEVFATYHAVVDQFWGTWSNRRTDGWGGSFENRMRFSAAILGGIREACGEDFIVGLAVSADPGSAAMPSVAELAEIVAWHDERRLMDYVTCGTGSYFDFYQIIPPSLYEQRLGEPFAAALKAVVRHALVQAESHIRTPAAAEAVIAAGHADMVSIVRGQIADPHLVAKARAGRADDVRPCISCNQLCWGRRSRDYWISCLVNPSAGREFEWGGDRFEPAAIARRVLVVGGGPAGLETARVAAERGHAVTLWERSDALGGQFRLAGLQPSRGQITDLLAWHGRQLAALGVDVRLGVEATAEAVAAFGADEVVVATGSRPARAGFQRALPMVDRLLGVDGADVVAIHDVLDGTATARIGRRVLVLDDLNDWRGLGTALDLAESGHEVTIADRGRGRRRRPVPQRGGRPASGSVCEGRRPVDHRHLGHGLAHRQRDRAHDRDRHRDDHRRRQRSSSPRRPSPRPPSPPTSPRAASTSTSSAMPSRRRRASLAFFEGRELARRL